MAGVGKQCGRARHSHRSCLAEGRVDVYKSKPLSKTCTYEQGQVTGILCCKKQKKNLENSKRLGLLCVAD